MKRLKMMKVQVCAGHDGENDDGHRHHRCNQYHDHNHVAVPIIFSLRLQSFMIITARSTQDQLRKISTQNCHRCERESLHLSPLCNGPRATSCQPTAGPRLMFSEKLAEGGR